MHEQYLLLALELAKKGRGQCAPNPSVGAVAVQNGTIIAQAWHRGAGTPHAEQLLLPQIPPETPGVTLYVTLEPCNHWGRTPPCVDAIIQQGVHEVVFAYKDPNPVVAQNDSTAILQSHGILVTQVSIPAIDEFYQSYKYWTLTKRPRVTVKMALSLDGKIAGTDGERRYLSNAMCNQFTHEMRAASDVILTSARTIQFDNPKMNVRLNTKEYAKPVAIIDSQLMLDSDSMIFSTAKCCHIYHHRPLPKSVEAGYPNSHFHWVTKHDKGLDLNAIIEHLGEIGYHDVWVEVGGSLFTALHQQQLVHRTYLYLTPSLLGENAISAYQQNNLFDKPHTVSWIEKGNNMIACFDWQEEMCLQE